MEMITLYRNEEVCLEYSTNMAFEGKYFLGHTPILVMHGMNAYGAVFNPLGSGVNLYINSISLSNYSDRPLDSHAWMNCPLKRFMVSPFVSTSNFAKRPLTAPKAKVAYQQAMPYKPSDGISLFPLISEANKTTIGYYYGRYIVPPGGSFLVSLGAPDYTDYKVCAKIAFGWWEDKNTELC